MLIDAHTHLDAIDGDPADVLARARSAGIHAVVTIGVDVATSEWAASAASRYDDVWATAGLHPHDADDCSPAALKRLELLAASERVVGIGETGLDYFYDKSPRFQQRRVFIDQIELARRTERTLVVHTRDAWDDTFAILEDASLTVPIVFHCWTGGPAEAERALAIGAFLSFSGIITFKNAAPIQESAVLAPLEQIMVESDAPFLAPVPYRGKPNEPAYVRHTADKIASLKGVFPSLVDEFTVANTQRAFGLNAGLR